jgi:hypothetical protein
MNRVAFLVALIAVVSSFTGCKVVQQLKKAGESAQQAASGAAATAAAGLKGASPEEQKDAELSEKLQGYIECLNSASRDALRSRTNYLRSVDADMGPTEKTRSVYVSEVTPDRCVKALEKVQNKTPALPEIQAAADEYKKALEALAPITKTLHQYYDRKDYKDDKFAKGQELHPKVMTAFAAFEKANDALDEKVTALNDEVGKRHLARLKDRPDRKLEYLIERSVDDAKKLVKLVDIDTIAKLDAAAYQAALDTYQASYTEFDTYATAHPEEVSKVLSLSFFKSSAEDYLKAGKELMRRKRDNKDFTKELGSPEHVEGHPARVIRTFNTLVDRSNSLTFRYSN